MNYIDIHCHLDFPDYDTDREDVIVRAQAEGVGIINVGVDIPTSRKVIGLAETHDNMWATVAIHPNHTGEPFDIVELSKLARHPKIVAIGECGLDYFRTAEDGIARQREVFLQHIILANEVNKPLMLHVRNGKENKSAYRDAIDLLKHHSKVGANFHCFAGSMEELRSVLDIGATVSFTGIVTFTKDYDEVVKNVPIDRIMSETDAPFLSPIPYRGKRNEPLYIKDITAKLASIRGVPTTELAQNIIDNARRIFSI